MLYVFADDILDVMTDRQEPADDGRNTSGCPTRWQVCYSINRSSRGSWYRVWRYRHPRSRRVWIEIGKHKLFISRATWTALEARRFSQQHVPFPTDLKRIAGPSIEIASTLQDTDQSS